MELGRDPLLSPVIEVTDEGIEVRNPEPQSDLSLVELLPVQGFLGIEDPGARQRTQMKEIWDYFSKDSQGVADALFKIKQTEMRMSPPKLGESRLSKLHSFVKTKLSLTDLEAQLDSL